MNKVLSYQNKKIFYRIIGSGKPVVLIHGFGEDGEIWINQVNYLKDKFTLIIPDLPGSGKSEMIDDMSIEGIAEVIKSILDVEAPLNPPQGGTLEPSILKGSIKLEDSKAPPCEGFGKACIIGHSMGGYISLALVEKYPNHISAFGLFHSSAYADTEEKKETRRKGIDFINQNGAFEFLKITIPNLFSPNSRIQIPDSIEQLINSGHNFSPAALISYYEAMMARPDRTKMLQNAAVPVLFIIGKYDNAVPPDDGLKQCQLPEKSYIYILRNSGHMGMLEEKDRCNGILEEFLREI